MGEPAVISSILFSIYRNISLVREKLSPGSIVSSVTQNQVAMFNSLCPVGFGKHLSDFSCVRLVAEILIDDSTHIWILKNQLLRSFNDGERFGSSLLRMCFLSMLQNLRWAFLVRCTLQRCSNSVIRRTSSARKTRPILLAAGSQSILLTRTSFFFNVLCLHPQFVVCVDDTIFSSFGFAGSIWVSSICHLILQPRFDHVMATVANGTSKLVNIDDARSLSFSYEKVTHSVESSSIGWCHVLSWISWREKHAEPSARFLLLAIANIIVTWYSMIVRFFFPNFCGKIKLEFIDIN